MIHIDTLNVPLSFNGFYKVAVAFQRQRVIYTNYSGFASPALGSSHFHVSWRFLSYFIDFVSFRYMLFSYVTDFVVSFRFLTLQISSFLC
jgi:hypothetical protein